MLPYVVLQICNTRTLVVKEVVLIFTARITYIVSILFKNSAWDFLGFNFGSGDFLGFRLKP